MTTFQVMPALDAATDAALRDSIREHGILVPIVKDQDGNVLDGHHRERIAAELGVECPGEIKHVRDEDHAWELARTLNEDRRQLLDIEQRRAEVRRLYATGEHSQRAIAGALGVSRKVVRTDLANPTGPSGPVGQPERIIGLDGRSRPATPRAAAPPPPSELTREAPTTKRAITVAEAHIRDFEANLVRIVSTLETVALSKLDDVSLVPDGDRQRRWLKELANAQRSLRAICQLVKENT